METFTRITSTNLYLGTCKTCDRPYRVDLGYAYLIGQSNQSPDTLGQFTTITCPGNCGLTIKVERLAAVITEEVCDPRCMGAAGPSCSCACGGANHGAAWGTTATTYELESAIKTLRARQDRTERQREQRAAAKLAKKKSTFEAWVADGNQDIFDYLSNINGDYVGGFICDMCDMVGTQRPLSDRQAEVIRRIMKEQADRKAKQDAYEATKKAAPLGKGVTVEGTIISVKGEQDHYSYYDKTVWKMTVQCDGFRVWGTVPSSLIGPIITAGCYDELKGQKIRLTAEFVPSKGDPSFAIFKRPRADKI